MGNFSPQGHVEVSNWLKHYLYLPPKTGNIADCSDPLGLSTNQISDDSVFATSWQPGRSGPWYGRLNNESRRSWCSTVSDDNQYIQVNNNIAFCQILLQFLFGLKFRLISVNPREFSLKLKTAFNVANVRRTLPDYPGVSRMQTKSAGLTYTGYQISRTLQMKVYKIRFSDIFWLYLILAFWGNNFVYLIQFYGLIRELYFEQLF